MDNINNKKFTVIIGVGGRLGNSLAVEFAKKNKHLILVSQAGDNLFELSRFLENQYDVVTHFYETDFAEKEVPYILKDWLSSRFSVEGFVLNKTESLPGGSDMQLSIFSIADLLIPHLEKESNSFCFTFDHKSDMKGGIERFDTTKESTINYSFICISPESGDQSEENSNYCDPVIVSRLAVAAATNGVSFRYLENQSVEKINDLY